MGSRYADFARRRSNGGEFVMPAMTMLLVEMMAAISARINFNHLTLI